MAKSTAVVDVQDLVDSISLDDIVKQIEKKKFDSLDTNGNGPGRGRKQCPECKSYVGVRTGECNCGYVFNKDAELKLTIAEKRKVEDAATEEERNYAMAVCSGFSGTLVYVASGKCPYHFVGEDYDSISAACWQIVYDGLNDGKIYLPSAIKHWIGHRFGFNSKKYKRICEHVDKWANKVVVDFKKINLTGDL